MAQKYFKANVDKLESLRIARGWSREALADKALVSTRTLDSLMAGENGVLSTFAKLAKALDTPVNSLLDGYESPAVQQRGPESPPDASAILSTQPIKGIKIWIGDSSTYTLDTPREVLAYLLGQSIEAQQKIVVIEITKGSIIVELEMSEEDVLRLVAAFAEIRLDSIHVEAIRLPPTTGPLAAGLLQIIRLPDTSPGEISDPVTPELTLTRTPTKSLPFSVEPPTSFLNRTVPKRLSRLSRLIAKMLAVVMTICLVILIISIYLAVSPKPWVLQKTLYLYIALLAVVFIVAAIYFAYVLIKDEMNN